MAVRISIPETAARGEAIEVKLLIQHPMETGFRTGQDGRLVPRDIIDSLTCEYLGQVVFRVELFPAVAANPFLAFRLRARDSGEVRLSWTDSDGTHVETRMLTVA